MARRRGTWLVGCGAIVLLVLLLAALGLRAQGGVHSRSLLVLDLGGAIEEQGPASALGRLLEGRRDTILGVRALLRAAARDPRVSALLVRPQGLDIGFAKADELREQIRRFQESGKPAVALLETAGTLDYYVASACPQVYMPPQGQIFLRGVLADVPFLRGLLDKLRVQPDFVATGRYKSAPDLFTRSGMSPAQREVVDSLLDQGYARLRDALAEARRLEPARAGALLGRALYNGLTAVEAGLADAALYEDQVVARLEELSGGRLRRLSHADYQSHARSDQRGPKVAVIYATGQIVPGSAERLPDGTRFAASQTLADILREVRRDDAVRAVVLRVDSPGGSASAADTLWREVALTREKKPVVVSMSDLAASGGYWISAPASRVVAAPMTLTGSIGVFAGKFNLQGLYGWAGLKREIVQRGENADLFSDYRSFSPAQRALLQEEIDSTYRQFIDRVVQGRGLDPAAVEAAGQGRVWSGSQARDRGLVDVLGGFDKALEEARALAGIDPDAPLRLEFHPRERTLLEGLLSGDLARAWTALSRLAGWIETAGRALEQEGFEVHAIAWPVLPN
jgi:protease-4